MALLSSLASLEILMKYPYRNNCFQEVINYFSEA